MDFLLHSEFVVVDIETTGVTPDLNEVLEIGAVKIKVDGERYYLDGEFHTLIRPYHEIPHNIQNLTSITPELVENAPRLESVAQNFLDFLGDAVFVAHNVYFDVKMLNNSLARIGVRQIENEALDTQKLVAIAYPTLDSHKLGAIAQVLGIDTGSSHRALDDARVTAHVFMKVVDTFFNFKVPLLHEINRMLASTHFPLKEIFKSAYHHQMHQLSMEDAQKQLGWQKLVHDFYHLKDFGRLERKDPQDWESLKPEELDQILMPGGLMSQKMPAYEMRNQQLEAMQWITQAFNESKHLLIEAGTGTGKSIAYLLPAIFFAVQNHTPLVISTRTKNLQDQLIEKDIPLLKSLLPFDFNVIDIKGRENYVCIRKMERTLREVELSGSEADKINAVPLLVWISQTTQGDINELHSATFKAFHGRIKSQSETCLNDKCQYFHRCFALTRRRESKKADVIITNHALLFADMASENNLLPHYQHVVLDEGHALEDAASEAFSHDLTQGSVGEALRRFPTTFMDDALLPLYERMRANSTQFFNVLRDMTQSGYEQETKQVVINDQFKAHALWQPLLLVQHDWLKSMQQFLELAQKKLEDAEDEGDQVSIKASLIALQMVREQIGFVIKGDPNFVSWVELTSEREPHRVHLRAAPIDVGPLVQEHLFAKNKSVIVTSATLQVRERFDYLKQRLGFLENTELEFSEQAVGSPFEYEKQVLFCVPADIPQVSTDKEFVAYTNDFLQQLFSFCKGKTLILFTSYKTLQAVYSKLRVPMERRGFHVLCQGKHGSRRAILNRFKECEKGILLGTDSFWEGVDIADLDCVVIQKLPFAVPSDVLQMARTEKITGQGENSFMAYTLPQAIMKFRQGAGRLIRSKTGHGAIIVLDRRIFEKNYGGMFREALPKCTYIQADKEKVLEEIELWLSQKNAATTPQTSASLAQG